MEAKVYAFYLTGLLCILILKQHLVRTVDISMNPNITGIITSNGTSLVCTFTRLKAEIILQLSFKAYGVPIMVMYPPSPPVLAAYGKYLEGRVILGDITITETNTTHVTSEISLIFTDLQCIDNKTYTCEIGYSDSKNIFTKNESIPSTLKVKVEQPSHQPRIKLIRYNNTIEDPIKNTTKTPTSNTDDECFIKLNSDYVECENIAVECTGEVGYSSQNLTVMMIQSDGTNESLVPHLNTSNTDTENCSLYQTNSFITNLTMRQNKAVFRCALPPFINQDGMFDETGPINILYSVQKPTIYTSRDNYTYPPLTLSCFADGNPEVIFTWYKNHNLSQEERFHKYSNYQNITLTSASDSGNYTCKASNTIDENHYAKIATITIVLEEITTEALTTNEAIDSTSEMASTATTTPSSPGVTETNKGNSKHNIYYVIGGVGGVVILTIVVVFVIYCKIRNPKKTRRNEDLSVTRQSLGVDNYNFVYHDDNGKGQKSAEKNVRSTYDENRKHNKNYLEYQEKDNTSNTAEGGHQPVEYAMVNKPRKGGKSQTQEQVHQPTEYVQVNKVNKRTSYEIPIDDNAYASGQEIYDRAHDRRHKKPKDFEPYDTTANISRQSEKVGSVGDNTGKPIKQKQVAKIKPSGRSGYENAGLQPDDILKTKDEPNTAL